MKASHWIEQAAKAMDEAGLHFGHGTDNPGDEAAWLLLHVIGAPLDGSFQDWSLELDPVQRQQADQLLADRIGKGIPLAYILGRAFFAGLEFAVNEQVLVPRSPIAELVLERFSPWVDATAVHEVLDLCTGSGCIGIAVATYLPWVNVDATDISSRALELARGNVHRHGVESRVRLLQSDLFSALGGRRYDLIVTNPPYIPLPAIAGLPDEYRAEPEIGLVSGEDGLEASLQILLQAADYLREGGILLCEVGESEQRLAQRLPGVPFTWLEFQHGGSGVFLLGRDDLQNIRPAVGRAIAAGRQAAGDLICTRP